MTKRKLTCIPPRGSIPRATRPHSAQDMPKEQRYRIYAPDSGVLKRTANGAVIAPQSFATQRLRRENIFSALEKRRKDILSWIEELERSGDAAAAKEAAWWKRVLK